MYGLDEPLVVLPLDKMARATRNSCVVLRVIGLQRDLKKHHNVLQIHHRLLSTASVVGTLTNFGDLYRGWRATAPHTEEGAKIERILKQRRLVMLYGDQLDSLKTVGTMKWRYDTIYHYDGALNSSDALRFRVGIGKGKVYSADATAYYSSDLISRMTYQFMEGPLNEADKASAPEGH